MTATRTMLVAAGAAAALLTADAGRECSAAPEVELEIAKIYWEYNSSADDLGVHVFLDGEDWKRIKIVNPDEKTIFNVEGKGPYKELGMTELFFEGAEPSLADVPLAELLDLFPEGEYEFDGRTVDGADVSGTSTFSHAIPAGPVVGATLGPSNSLVIGWTTVTSPPPGFPNEPITIVGYQVIVGSFQVTVPATANSVTVSPEFVASLPTGDNAFEVLAIDASGNQTITEGSFVKP
jgi:hypothetical protein